jgi:hypothetical protein
MDNVRAHKSTVAFVLPFILPAATVCQGLPAPEPIDDPRSADGASSGSGSDSNSGGVCLTIVDDPANAGYRIAVRLHVPGEHRKWDFSVGSSMRI